MRTCDLLSGDIVNDVVFIFVFGVESERNKSSLSLMAHIKTKQNRVEYKPISLVTVVVDVIVGVVLFDCVVLWAESGGKKHVQMDTKKHLVLRYFTWKCLHLLVTIKADVVNEVLLI